MNLSRPYLAIALIILSIPGAAISEEESYLREAEDPENYSIDYILKPYEEDFFNFLDTPHEFVSEGVELMAQEVDLFFADEKIYTETTASYARLSNELKIGGYGETSMITELYLKVDLAKTKGKLKLLLESDTDRDIQTGTNTKPGAGPRKETSNIYAALQKEVAKKNDWHTKASVGVKVKVPLDPFLRLQIFKDFNLGDWKMRFNETLFWFNSKGAGASSVLELDYPFTPTVLFRSRTSELWTDFLDYHEVEQSFTLFHELTKRRAISYTIGAYNTSEPTFHTDRYYAYVNYRQKVHREWLFIEITPALTYQAENDFRQERSLMLKLEMVFGSKYAYRQTEY